MKKIDLGKISIAMDEYASQGNAVLGIRGSGKSYTATYIAERLLDAGLPIVAFDPIGIWRFLRVPALPGGQGYKVVVAGGAHGDIPLPANGAAEIMRAAMREGVSIVFDLYDISLSKADWRRVVESAIKVLLYENKVHGLRHIFLEEAAEFAPQRIQPEQGAVYSAIERLARMGGNAQLGYTLINQRSEEVNKAVLELCDLLILHRQKGRNSLTSLSKWLDVASVKGKIAEEVPGLGNGECYIWPSGDAQPVKTTIPAKRTFHPDRKAMQKAEIAEAKTADVSAFVTTMRASLEHLAREAEANDPKLLRAEIAKLKREILNFQAAGKVDNGPTPEWRAEYGEAHARDTENAYARGRSEVLTGVCKVLGSTRDDLQSALANIDAVINETGMAQLKAYTPAPKAAKRSKTSQIYEKSSAKYAVASSGQLSKAERLVLTALAQYPAGRTKAQVAILTGYAVNGGGFNNAISAARSKGYLEGTTDRLTITDGGIAALGTFTPLPEGDALLQHWYRQLGKAERACLEALAQAYPGALSKDEVARRAGYEANGGGFNNALSRLRTLELISGRGELRASEDLFNDR